MSYIINEAKKSISVCGLVSFVFLILAVNIILYLLYDNRGVDWRENAVAEKAYYVEAFDQINGQGEDKLGIMQTCVEQIAIIDYSLEKNIPYQQMSVFENISRNSMFSSFVIIVISLVAYNVISVEFSNDTWKNVVIFHAGNYKRILARKRITSYVIMLITILMFLLLVVLFGVFVYKDLSNVVLYYQEGRVIQSTYNKDILDMIVGLIAGGVFYSGLAILLAALFKDNKVGSILLVLCIVFETGMQKLGSQFGFSDFLPFDSLSVLRNITEYNKSDIVVAIVIVSVYVTLMEFVSYIVLKKTTRK